MVNMGIDADQIVTILNNEEDKDCLSQTSDDESNLPENNTTINKSVLKPNNKYDLSSDTESNRSLIMQNEKKDDLGNLNTKNGVKNLVKFIQKNRKTPYKISNNNMVKEDVQSKEYLNKKRKN